MSRWSDLVERVRSLVFRAREERELREELDFHLDMEQADLERSGLPAAEARRRARLDFGGRTQVQEEVRDARGTGFVDRLRQDLRYAFRGIVRSPAFAATVILTLGLGIGANTAMFGVVDRLLFKPFPYLRDPDAVHKVYLRSFVRNGFRIHGVSEYTRFLDLSRNTSSFSQVAGYTNITAAVGSGEAARERQVGVVSASFFAFFDAPPALGRYFTSAEDQTPRGADVAVITWEMWQTELGGRRDVIGQPLQVHNLACLIIGVLPRGFVGIWDGNPPVVYVPITTYAGSNPYEEDRTTYYTQYNWGWMDMMVRRRPDVSVAAASADLSQASVTSWESAVALNPRWAPVAVAQPSAIAAPLKAAAGPDPSVETRTLWWVSGIAVIVLLIACSNVANLLLARALRRRRETAVRLALGVSRRRLAGQWFTETMVLALGGGVAGIAIAQFGGGALRRLFVGADGAPIPVAGDGRTLLVTFGLAVAAALLTGLVPALAATRFPIGEAIKVGVREGTYQRSPLRTALLGIQVTLSVMLLIGAGLFVRSFVNVQGLRLGYDVEQVVLVQQSHRGVPVSDSQVVTLSRAMLERTASLPGVTRAALMSSIPFWSTSSTTLIVPGIDSTEALGQFSYQVTTADYFATMDTRILAGRAYDERDRAGTERVAVVSEAMAAALWPGENPIGKLMRVGDADAPFTTVIGVAENAAQRQLEGDDRFRYYLPMEQFRPGRASRLVALVRGDPAVMGETLRKALQPLMPGESYVTSVPMRQIISQQQRAWRFGATMFVAFGGLALLVAAIGLYGVIGYNVAQRLHELGVRAALGAQRRDLIRLVMTETLQVAGAGLVIGVLIAWAAGGRIQPLLFRQSARDPAVFALVAVTLAAVAALAGLGPARRAARVDPNTALRTD